MKKACCCHRWGSVDENEGNKSIECMLHLEFDTFKAMYFKYLPIAVKAVLKVASQIIDFLYLFLVVM